MIINSNEKDFENAIKGKLVMVDFSATWCGPCRMLAQELNDFENEKYDIIKIDVDENPKLTKQYGIMAVPTVFVLKDGKEIDKFSGYKTSAEIKEFMSKHI